MRLPIFMLSLLLAGFSLGAAGCAPPSEDGYAYSGE